MSISLEAISYYLPDQITSNEDLSKEFSEWTADAIYEKNGNNKKTYCCT